MCDYFRIVTLLTLGLQGQTISSTTFAPPTCYLNSTSARGLPSSGYPLIYNINLILVSVVGKFASIEQFSVKFSRTPRPVLSPPFPPPPGGGRPPPPPPASSPPPPPPSPPAVGGSRR